MNTIKINDKEITVQAIKVKDLPAVCMAVEPFINEFGKMAKNGNITNNDLFKLCAMYSPDVVTLCVVMTDVDKEWLKEQEPQVLFELTCEVIRQSQDFFLKQIIKPIQKIASTLTTLALTMK